MIHYPRDKLMEGQVNANQKPNKHIQDEDEMKHYKNAAKYIIRCEIYHHIERTVPLE